jgi:pyruvate/2-oxoglutarate dehydrogenase complex dihydrolipoamide dehydrogenase (E3) component
VVATGTRPTRISDNVIPGISHAIDSDDVFFLKELPKKTIVIGGKDIIFF